MTGALLPTAHVCIGLGSLLASGGLEISQMKRYTIRLGCSAVLSLVFTIVVGCAFDVRL